MIRKTLPCLGLLLAMLACALPAGLSGPAATPTQIPSATLPANPILVDTPFPTPVFTPAPTLQPLARIESGEQAFFNGDWETALREYQAALQNNLNQPDLQAAALSGLGRTYYRLGQYAQALNTFRQLLAEYPDSPYQAEALIALAQTYEALDRYADAAQAYASYLDLQPGVLDAYVQEWLGDALAASGEYVAAIDVYQAAMAAERLGDSFGVQVKIAGAYQALGDLATALVVYQDVYNNTSNDYLKAQVDYRMGQVYLALGQTEPGYAAYLDAVENYPLAYDSYLALIELVNAGYPVSEYDRGIVDYFAGQYSLAIAAFDRHLAVSAENAGTTYYYKGLALRVISEPLAAIAAWEILIQSYPDDPRWEAAWEQKAYTLWAYLERYDEARQTLLDFVREDPWNALAPEYLYNAGRIAERATDLAGAAEIWERIPPEYPASEYVSQAIFQAGIAHYRRGDYASSLMSFKQLLGSTPDLGEQAAAHFWIGKSHQASGDASAAQAAWQLAIGTDPTGYYSERARDLLLGRPAFAPPVMYDLGFDLAAERTEAETWMRTVFAIPEAVDLNGPGTLVYDGRLTRGTALWNLGFYELARAEFESLRLDSSNSPTDTYRLANYLLELGLYRSAIFAARQVLNLAGMDDAATLNAPAYFNHVRFGSYYRELIIPAAQAYDFHPLFLFSLVRQESLFEGFVRSSAGARGLMQIMPATGQSIVTQGGWPPDYTADDLYRPYVSIALGTNYLDAQRDYFAGDLYAALAAYNGGPGNAAIWRQLANGDPDLMVEIIRFEETRNYVRGIYEVFSIYRRLYDRTP